MCKNGPYKERSCTDCFCLILFMVFLGTLGVVCMEGMKNGDPYRLSYPYDPDRNFLQLF